MKKNSILIGGGILLAALMFGLEVSALTLNTDGSYRSQATGGLFKQEVDRIYDNPAYIGAKLDGNVYLEYEKSMTKEKTNVYTGLAGYNGDNRYLLGCSSRMGDRYGLAGLLEVGINETPQYFSSNLNVPPFNVTITGTGKAESIQASYTDTNSDQIFDHKVSLSASREYYTEENIVNGIFGLGGYALGGMTVGFSFERNVDGSFDTYGASINPSYVYTATNLLNGFVSSSIDHKEAAKNSTDIVNYIARLGAVIPMGGMPLEGILTVALNDRETSTTRSIDETRVTGGLSTDYSSSGTDSTISDDGYTLGLQLQTRTEFMNFKAQPYFSWTLGGNSPNESGHNTTNGYTESVLTGNSEYVSRSTTTNTTTYDGDGITRNVLALGSNFRKYLAEDLLLGLGAEYQFTRSSNKYKGSYTARTVAVFNNGNGLVDLSDYTRTTTESYRDSYEDKVTGHVFQLPIGLEYAATPTLSFRLGYMFTALFDKTDSRRNRSNLNASYWDYDYDAIPGNETTYDSLASTTATTAAASHTVEKNRDMVNTYSAGVGYNLADKVQLDLTFMSGWGNYNDLNTLMIMTSATFVY